MTVEKEPPRRPIIGRLIRWGPEPASPNESPPRSNHHVVITDIDLDRPNSLGIAVAAIVVIVTFIISSTGGGSSDRRRAVGRSAHRGARDRATR